MLSLTDRFHSHGLSVPLVLFCSVSRSVSPLFYGASVVRTSFHAGISLSPPGEFWLPVIYALVVLHAVAQVVYTVLVSHALSTVEVFVYGMLTVCAIRNWPMIYVSHAHSW